MLGRVVTPLQLAGVTLLVTAVVAMGCAGADEARDSPGDMGLPAASNTGSAVLTETEEPAPPASLNNPDPALTSSGHPRLASLRDMAETYRVIVIGEVLPDAPVQHYRKDGAPCPLPYMVYRVAVKQLINPPDPPPTEPLAVAVFEGQFEARCGSPEGEIVTARPGSSLSPGSSYIFFLNDQRDNGLPAYTGERFELGEDGRALGNGTELYNAGPAALVGASVDEAAQKLLAVIAEAPLPEIPSWMQPYVTTTPSAALEPTAAPTAAGQ